MKLVYPKDMKNKKLGVLSFICGICGVVCLFFYINTLDGEIAYLTLIVGITSLCSGITQLVKEKRTGFAITGIVLSILILGVLFVFIESLRNVNWSFG